MPVLQDGKPQPDDAVDDAVDDAAELTCDGVQSLSVPAPEERPGLGNLLSSARHELGSPLQSIQGFAELLDSQAFGELNQEQRGFLKHILGATQELRGAMEACFELAELELVGRDQSPESIDLRAALAEALEQAGRRQNIHGTLPMGARMMRVKLDRELFRRAIEALLIALSAHDSKSFTFAAETAGGFAQVTIAHTGRSLNGASFSLDELVHTRHLRRNLVWFRLASAALAAMGATLSLGEQLDYAEVRVRLSSTH